MGEEFRFAEASACARRGHRSTVCALGPSRPRGLAPERAELEGHGVKGRKHFPIRGIDP